MAILGISAEGDSYIPVRSPVFVTAATGIATPDSRNLINPNTLSSWVRISHVASGDFWTHFIASYGNPVIEWKNTATDRINFRINNPATNSSVYDFQWSSDGTTFTTIGSFFMTSILSVFDFYIKRGSSGVVKFYVNGILIFSATGNFNTPDLTFDQLVIKSTVSLAYTLGQCIISDTSTLNFKLTTVGPNAAGTSSAWTGAYTAIDEFSVTTGTRDIDYSDSIYTNANGVGFLAVYGAMNTLVGTSRDIKAVVIAGQGSRHGASTPVDARFFYRHSATNYTGNLLGFIQDGGMINAQQILPLDPLGAPWTEVNVNAFQVGVTT
jgi:hypothetical protein